MVKELEEFWSPTPILAIKEYRHIGWFGNRKYFGRGQTTLIKGVETLAECCCGRPWVSSIKHHKPPYGLGMNCGFYGRKGFIYVIESWYHHGLIEPTQRIVHYAFIYRLLDLLSRRVSWVLVEFSGRVIEYEGGYRAERQKIVRKLRFWEILRGRVRRLERGYR